MDLSKMREQIDELTGGGLYELNRICVENELDPNLCVSPEGDETSRYTFFATNVEGDVVYHRSVYAPKDRRLEIQLDVWLKLRDIKKQTARIREGLVRLEAGLDPEEPKPTVTLH